MGRGSTIMAVTTLAFACARGGDLRLDRAGELQTQYEDRKQDVDGCMLDFGDCLGGALDADAIAACAESLQVCLETAEQQQEPEGLETGDGGLPPDGDTEGDTDAEPQPDPGDDLGAVCEPLLDACLEDPANFDPFCMDDFEECVELQVAFALQALCDEVVAECLALEIPNYDCFGVCQ